MPPLSPRPRARRTGFTLFEMAITIAIVSSLLIALGLALVRAQGAYQVGVTGANVDASARRLLQRVAAEFMDADRSSLQLSPPAPFPSSSVDYVRVTGFAAGVTQLGPTRQLALELEDGELDDGLDNDSDGLVDECRIVLVPDLVGEPGRRNVLASNVREYLAGEVQNGVDDNGNGIADERGLQLLYDPDSLSLLIRVTIERRSAQGTLMACTAQTAVMIRND